MAQAEISDRGDVMLSTQYQEGEAAKLVPGTRWDKDERVWRLPLAWGPMMALRGIFGSQVSAGPRLQAWLMEHHQRRVLPAWELNQQTELQLGGVELMGLWPLQRVGVGFLTLNGGEPAILGDDMGTGKTVQASAALQVLSDAYVDDVCHGYDDSPNPLPALVVCPEPVRHQAWRKELEKWTDLRVVVADGNVNQRRKAIQAIKDGEADVLVMGWAVIPKHTRLASYGGTKLRRCAECGSKEDGAEKIKPASCETHEKELNEITWETIIVDEAHRASNPKAKSTRALWWLGKSARIRWALTGTPIKDHLDSAFGLLHFVSPEDFPSYVKMRDRYCLTAYNPFSGGQDVIGLLPATQQELYSILDPLFMRRTKAQAMPWLPPKVHVRREVKLQPKHRKLYNAMRDDLLVQFEDGSQLIAFNPLEQGLRLSQIAAATPVVEERVDDEGLLHTDVVALKDPSPKLDELERILEEMGDRPCVVFAPSLKLLRLAKQRLTNKGISYGSVDGDTSTADREQAVDEFQEGRRRVMLLTAAGAEGLTLTRADTIVFLQRPWSMIQSNQAEDRVHRGGAEVHDKVTIIDIIAEDTDDEKVLDALQGKIEGAEEILRDRQRLAAYLRSK